MYDLYDIPKNLTMTFSEYYDSIDTFKAKYNELPSNMKLLTDAQVGLVYCLLLGEYANSRFANLSIDQANMRIFTTLYSYGPAYFKKKEIQTAITNLDLTRDLDIILAGTTAIYNSAANDGGLPTTQTSEELGFVDSQNTTKYRRSKLEGYANYYELISNDPTKDFLAKFKSIFAKYITNNLFI